jgi:hypothetical protein
LGLIVGGFIRRRDNNRGQEGKSGPVWGLVPVCVGRI